MSDWFERAMEKTTVENGCWRFNYDLTLNGYGRLIVDGKRTRIHRLSYEKFIGPIKQGYFICHHCDVRNCWNPDHLFEGDAQANYDDMKSKCRVVVKTVRGELSGTSKLTEEDIRHIRNLGKEPISKEMIGRLFGVSRSAIRRVIERKT